MERIGLKVPSFLVAYGSWREDREFFCAVSAGVARPPKTDG